MTKRRDLIKGAFALPFVAPSISLRKRGEEKLKPGDFERDYFKELGLRTFINAAGTYTALTASLPHPEVIKAINYSALQFVKLEDLQDKVGERLAELLQCEFAMVTAGAASAITLGTAGIVTGGDWDKIAQIPNDMTGMKTEVIIQKTHRVGYDHAIRNCGLKVIEVESAKELEAAINNNTAMMWFLNASNFLGKVRDEEFVTIAKRHQIPTMIDCAADVPPVEMLWKHTKMGFDLVCFSGGKGLRGPQSAGLLLGKKALVTAARRNAPPNGNTVGRGMKVNKEEILGMLVAIEQYLSRDHQKDWKLWESQVNLIYDAATSVPGVIGEKHVPQIANHVPSLNIKIDQSKVNMTCDQLRIALREGHPSIETVGDASTLGITTWMMIPGEERTVAKRIKEILLSASIK
ncbi:MAG: aminotransferase class V-fold PLP-dependent enzyme [Saprospiraceae bacterium]|nr:aminotransferase class V-fold PLP-dependent enzyme [Saprospiraceae bacterium]MBK8779659.1 aminotransferase class V-fold PLP-dependent enzyme [Saprospiraceae bacterium]MBK9681324.1 aminotransferase class V-fold PLP-dependent enzyme [Saprospiraceae bacterium]MBK9928697.1 aminotransferase class V-fold PLP-dependent enzyme [Saprospiraceae bacterium]MBP8942006.1 aminotransferase class V-fold PLP-dependent enzyme [Saprospiraceae bacterium]